MSLIIPDSATPSNLQFHDGVTVRTIDSDLFDISSRIEEISDRLFIVVADDGSSHQFIIMENCDDGVARRIFKCDELDNRLLEKLRYIMGVPFEERYAIAVKEMEKYEAEKEQEAADELYERMGGPMYNELERCGFIQRSTSYPKRRKHG